MDHDLYVIGVETHRNDRAPSFYIAKDQRCALLRTIRAQLHEDMQECVLLSTCHRVELIGYGGHLAQWQALFEMLFAEKCDLNTLYARSHHDALEHLLALSCGLKSVALGENEIVSQLKNAFSASEPYGLINQHLRSLLPHILHVSKKVRSGTDIGNHSISLASLGAQRIHEQIGARQDQRLVCIGAGMMMQSICRYLTEMTFADIRVINRSFHGAKTVMEILPQASYHSIDTLSSELSTADVIICATEAPTPLIDGAMIEQLAQSGRSIYLLDLSVPCDVDTTDLPEQISVDNLSSLREISAQHRLLKSPAITEAQQIILEEINAYQQMRCVRHASAAIMSLRDYGDNVYQKYLDQALDNIAQGKEAEQVISSTMRQLVNHLLHGPTVYLRSAAASEENEKMEQISSIFNVDNTWEHRLLETE